MKAVQGNIQLQQSRGEAAVAGAEQAGRSRRKHSPQHTGTQAGRRTWLLHLLVAVALLMVGFWVNRGIRIEGLYMDDLYMWSCYGEQSFWEFAFPIGTSTRFRPVYWTATYLQMLIIQNHVSWFVPMNIILNAGVAFTIYCFARHLSKNTVLSAFCGVLYLVSHFAYYQIGQALGLLETMALWMALVILWLLYGYMQAGGGRRKFYWALVVYFLLAFTHERYVGLLPLFYLALGMGDKTDVHHGMSAETEGQKSEKMKGAWVDWLLPLLNFGLIFLIRKLAIGAAIPAGTGGTEVTETFSLAQALMFAVDQVKYLFGVNIGPEYLSGKTWSECAPYVHKLVYASWVVLLLFVISFLYTGVKQRLFLKKSWVGSNLLFLAFIALCIGCSSVTIRVEMRWVYVSYAAALLYLAYMAGIILGDVQKSEVRAGLALLMMLYFACLFPAEQYYRSFYPQIYFWENQDRMNSLAEETVLKYGVEGVLGKQVYILENSYEMTDFYAETFFKVYDPEKTGRGTVIHFIDNAGGLPYNATIEDTIVLKEVPEQRGYQDITDEILGQ